MPTKAELDAAASAEKASFLADQILESAQALAGMLTDDPNSVPPIGEIVKAAELLRPLLSWGNLALIGVQPAAIEGVFSGLDVEVLRVLADHAKIVLPLRLVPGWRFDEFMSRPDLATLVRHALWRTLHRLPSAPAVA